MKVEFGPSSELSQYFNIRAADVFLGWLLGSLFLGTFQMAALAPGDVCAMMLIDFPPSSQPQRRWLPSQRRLSGLRVGLAPVSKSAAYRGKTRRGNWDISGSTRLTRKTQHFPVAFASVFKMCSTNKFCFTF